MVTLTPSWFYEIEELENNLGALLKRMGDVLQMLDNQKPFARVLEMWMLELSRIKDSLHDGMDKIAEDIDR